MGDVLIAADNTRRIATDLNGDYVSAGVSRQILRIVSFAAALSRHSYQLRNSLSKRCHGSALHHGVDEIDNPIGTRFHDQSWSERGARGAASIDLEWGTSRGRRCRLSGSSGVRSGGGWIPGRSQQEIDSHHADILEEDAFEITAGIEGDPMLRVVKGSFRLMSRGMRLADLEVRMERGCRLDAWETRVEVVVGAIDVDAPELR